MLKVFNDPRISGSLCFALRDSIRDGVQCSAVQRREWPDVCYIYKYIIYIVSARCCWWSHWRAMPPRSPCSFDGGWTLDGFEFWKIAWVPECLMLMGVSTKLWVSHTRTKGGNRTGQGRSDPSCISIWGAVEKCLSKLQCVQMCLWTWNYNLAPNRSNLQLVDVWPARASLPRDGRTDGRTDGCLVLGP